MSKFWLLLLGFITLMSFAVVTTWIVLIFLDVLEKWFRRHIFRRKLCRAIKKHSPATWDDVMYIAKRQYLDERQVNFVVGGLIEKIITDNKSNLAPHIGLLRGYIGAYSKSQRLSGFPEELRTELKVIESALGTQQLLIVPLIIELRKFLSVSDTIERRARFSTHFGVVLGSVSIVISVLFYVIPLKTDPFEKCDVHNNTSSNQATH